MFSFKIQLWNVTEDKEQIDYGLVAGATYKDALENLIPEMFSEDEVLGIKLKYITETDTVLIPRNVLPSIEEINDN